jgi:primosomal protein N' (replication factor Y) (superfamily II helicase)
MAIARVALDVPVDSVFDYRTGEEPLVPGQLVVVPFGRRRQVGVVLETADSSEIPDARIRRIERIVAIDPLTPDLLGLIRFASGYYRCPIGQAALMALPAAFRRPGHAGPRQWRVYAVSEAKRASLRESLPVRAVAQRRLLAAFDAEGTITLDAAKAVAANAAGILEKWAAEGWVELRRVTVNPQRAMSDATALTGPSLNQEQHKAVDDIGATFGAFAPWLLDGVTGSGKTEVYFRLIERALYRRNQTLLMVPEINLTPQLEVRFKERFPGVPMVSLHSNLAEGERAERWVAASRGEAAVVLGTRLSVFTPMPRLGLIIVDEEHDPSFKQQDGLRYSGRDLAIYRAQMSQVPIVLGSATPSLESYQNASAGRYGHLRLSTRPQASMPTVRLVDTRPLPKWHGMTPPLIEGIRQTLERSEQSLVFLNRRGYAPALVCGACGWAAECHRCSAKLVWHLRDTVLRCHYCGFEQKLPDVCPGCGNQDMEGLGHGTQKIEQALAERFSSAKILRIDRDSTRRKHAWREMNESIRDDRVDILVGTQMLAKGHDFPNLTLVAIVNPDAALYSADFRAAERLFQQLMQVAGRAGRADHPGEVLVQTRFPEHPLYQALITQDYSAFARTLIAERKQSGFPPFVHQVLLRAESVSESAVTEFLSQAASAGSGLHRDVTLYDPVPAAMARIAGRYRGHLLAQAETRGVLQRFLDAWLPRLAELDTRKVRWALDVDPQEL